MRGTVTVRDWQTDSAHDRKDRTLRDAHRQPGDATHGAWAVRDGLVALGGQRTTAWAVRMVLSCQRARATEAC